jgi:hypothetical protein
MRVREQGTGGAGLRHRPSRAWHRGAAPCLWEEFLTGLSKGGPPAMGSEKGERAGGSELGQDRETVPTEMW